MADMIRHGICNKYICNCPKRSFFIYLGIFYTPFSSVYLFSRFITLFHNIFLHNTAVAVASNDIISRGLKNADDVVAVILKVHYFFFFATK